MDDNNRKNRGKGTDTVKRMGNTIQFPTEYSHTYAEQDTGDRMRAEKNSRTSKRNLYNNDDDNVYIGNTGKMKTHFAEEGVYRPKEPTFVRDNNIGLHLDESKKTKSYDMLFAETQPRTKIFTPSKRNPEDIIIYNKSAAKPQDDKKEKKPVKKDTEIPRRGSVTIITNQPNPKRKNNTVVYKNWDAHRNENNSGDRYISDYEEEPIQPVKPHIIKNTKQYSAYTEKKPVHYINPEQNSKTIASDKHDNSNKKDRFLDDDLFTERKNGRTRTQRSRIRTKHEEELGTAKTKTAASDKKRSPIQENNIRRIEGFKDSASHNAVKRNATTPIGRKNTKTQKTTQSAVSDRNNRYTADQKQKSSVKSVGKKAADKTATTVNRQRSDANAYKKGVRIETQRELNSNSNIRTRNVSANGSGTVAGKNNSDDRFARKKSIWSVLFGKRKKRSVAIDNTVKADLQPLQKSNVRLRKNGTDGIGKVGGDAFGSQKKRKGETSGKKPKRKVYRNHFRNLIGNVWNARLEFDLPSIHKISIWQYALRSLMLTSACVVAVMILFFSARLICSVRSINVYGNGAKKADIIAYSQLTKGMCMFDIDEAEVENHIEEKAPYIQADVQRLWLNKIDIKISNRIPYAAIECNAQYLIIDNEFVALEFIPKEQLSKYDLVVVRGLQSGNFQLSKKIGDEKSNAHIYDLNAMLEMINNADNSLKIVEVDVLNSNKLTCKTSDGLTILFGDSSDLDKKLATACEIIPLLSKKGLGKGVLDVRESGLYRKTKEETENTPVPAKSDDAIPKSGTVEPSQSGGA